MSDEDVRPRAIREEQARIVERMEVEPDDDGERHVVLDGRRVGVLVHDGRHHWRAFLLVGDERERLGAEALGDADDPEAGDVLLGDLAEDLAWRWAE